MSAELEMIWKEVVVAKLHLEKTMSRPRFEPSISRMQQLR
jgi:hypothetical protein